MENFFLDRRKALEMEKKNIQKQLNELSVEWKMNQWLARCFDVNITSMNQSKDIQVEKVDHGIFIRSSLKDEEERYFHFIETDEIEELTSNMESINDKLIALSFNGYGTDCDIEFRLTFFGNNDKEKEVRLSLGDKTIFRLHHLKQIKDIKVRLLLKGAGSVVLHNPQLLVKKERRLESHIIDENNAKSFKDIHILHVAKDSVIQKFKSDVRLVSVLKPSDVEKVFEKRPDVLICSSSWLVSPENSHNSGFVDSSILNDLLFYCVKHSIPTVFWDINPPYHASHIVKHAKYFDYILTANKESVAIFKNAGCKRVFILPYEVPLHIQNEIESYHLRNTIFIEKRNISPLLESLQNDLEDTNRKKERLVGLRTILENHTIKARLEKILALAQIQYQQEKASATMVARISSKRDYEMIMNTFKRQTMENKRLILLLDYFEGYLDVFNQNNTKHIKTYLLDYIHHYDNINEFIETSHFAPISTSHFYGKNYLKDMFLTTLYIRDAIIVKGIGREYTFVTKGQFDQAFFPRTFFESIKISELVGPFMEESGKSLEHWFPLGARFFNTDNFNLIRDYKQFNGKNMEHIEI